MTSNLLITIRTQLLKLALLFENKYEKELIEFRFEYIVNKEIGEKMAKVTKKEEAPMVLPTGAATVEVTPELDSFGYVFFRNPNGNFYTVKVKFDHNLTVADFSEVESAGGEKQLAIERLKILLATRVF